MKLFKSKQVTEDELIKGCIAEKRDMQRLLYERYAASMKGVCMRYAKTSFEAEDILHDAFVKVFSHIGTFKAECPLEQWIRKIVVNTALSAHRSRMQRLELNEPENLEALTEPVIAMPGHTADELMEMVQRLPEKYRVVFNLHAVEGYSHKEIGAMLEQPEVTTRSQYLRARTMLKEMIEKDYTYYNEKVRS